MGIGLTCSPHPLEIFGSGQSKFSLHPRLTGDLCAKTRRGLPTSLLDVFVGLYCELVTALEAAALEYCAAISRSHAFAETMHAHAAADLGLICSLRHSSLLPYFVKDDCAYPDCGASPIWGWHSWVRLAQYYTPMIQIRSI